MTNGCEEQWYQDGQGRFYKLDPVEKSGRNYHVILTADYLNELETARAQAGLAQRYREGLEGCWGQQEDGDLRFVVRVSGIGASPKSPVEIARELTQTWTAAMQGRGVVVDESSRDALTAGPTAAVPILEGDTLETLRARMDGQR